MVLRGPRELLSEVRWQGFPSNNKVPDPEPTCTGVSKKASYPAHGKDDTLQEEEENKVRGGTAKGNIENDGRMNKDDTLQEKEKKEPRKARMIK